MPRTQLEGIEKAAVLLLSLGSDLSAQVFKHLNEDEMEELARRIARMKNVASDTQEHVLDEFYNLCQARSYISRGGLVYAREILEKSVGRQKAQQVFERLIKTLENRPFEAVRRAEPAQLLSFIQGEHPQTIALIMAYMHPEQASHVLSALPPEVQLDVARRIALMDRTSPDVIKDIEELLETKLSTVVRNEYAAAGGIQSIVEVLLLTDRGTEKNVLDQMEEIDPELAEEIKQRMFVFEDIVLLDNRAVQLVMRQVDTHDIALALKTASSDVENIIYDNMSERAVEMLKEDIEYMGPVRIRDVEEAQQRIVNIIRKLEDNGEIVIARGGESEVIV